MIHKLIKDNSKIIKQFSGDLFFFFSQFLVLTYLKFNDDLISIGEFTTYIFAISFLSVITSFSRDTFLLKAYANNKKIFLIKNDAKVIYIGVIITSLLLMLSLINFSYSYIVFASFMFGIVNSEFSAIRYRDNLDKYLINKILLGILFISTFLISTFFLEFKISNIIISHIITFLIMLIKLSNFKYIQYLIKNCDFIFNKKLLTNNIKYTSYSLISPLVSYLETVIITSNFGIVTTGVFGYYTFLLRVFTFLIQGLNRFFAVTLMQELKNSLFTDKFKKILLLNFITGILILISSFLIEINFVFMLLVISTIFNNTRNLLSYKYFAINQESIMILIVVIIDFTAIIAYYFSGSFISLLILKNIFLLISVLILSNSWKKST